MGKATGPGQHVPAQRDQKEPVVRAEEEAESMRDADRPLGTPGRPMNRRSAFFVGFVGAIGALAALAAGYLVVLAGDVLILMLVAFFTAVGLHPAVSWLNRRGLPYALAAAAVSVAVVLLLAGFLGAALVPLVDQADRLAHQLNELATAVRDQDSLLGRLNRQFHLEQQLRGFVSDDAGSAIEAVTSVFVVLVLTIYFLADFRSIRAALYRLVPARRRARAILIGDQIYARIGAYLLGNLLLSFVPGAVSFVCLAAFRVPYALFLAVVAAVLDLVPLVGTLVAAVVVAAVALTVSVPACLGVLGVLAVYKLVEDYVLLPKLIGRVVSIPAVVTVVAVLLGGVLAGVAGALVSIPVAAAVLLILREVSFPWLDRT
jgi:predicted PurR-regulated permease PerM